MGSVELNALYSSVECRPSEAGKEKLLFTSVNFLLYILNSLCLGYLLLYLLDDFFLFKVISLYHIFSCKLSLLFYISASALFHLVIVWLILFYPLIFSWSMS